MKQTFEIEQDNLPSGIFAAFIENQLKDAFGRRFPITVTEITEPDEPECVSCKTYDCENCGKPIEVKP